MIKFSFIHVFKKINFILILFIWVGLFISKNGFAQWDWIREIVRITWIPQNNCITIAAGIYDYSYGPNSEHASLSYCKFEASVHNNKYFKLMEIQTPIQKNTGITKIEFKNKLKGAVIIFATNIIFPIFGDVWRDDIRKYIQVRITNRGNKSVIGLQWKLEQEFMNVRYIRVTGVFKVGNRIEEHFHEVVYDLYKPNQNALKSSTPDTIKKESENDAVNLLKDSESIIIKGADPGANIKVYSPSGFEIKSVISNNDVVNIKLPANQIYIVHIGKSRFKVAL